MLLQILKKVKKEKKNKENRRIKSSNGKIEMEKKTLQIFGQNMTIELCQLFEEENSHSVASV
jgi:hypothetical protein